MNLNEMKQKSGKRLAIYILDKGWKVKEEKEPIKKCREGERKNNIFRLKWHGLAVNTCTITKLNNSNWIGDCLSHFFFVCVSVCVRFVLCYDQSESYNIWCINIALVRATFHCCYCCSFLLAKSYQASSVSKIWLIRYGACFNAMSAKVPFVWIKKVATPNCHYDTSKLVTLQRLCFSMWRRRWRRRQTMTTTAFAINFVSYNIILRMRIKYLIIGSIKCDCDRILTVRYGFHWVRLSAGSRQLSVRRISWFQLIFYQPKPCCFHIVYNFFHYLFGFVLFVHVLWSHFRIELQHSYHTFAQHFVVHSQIYWQPSLSSSSEWVSKCACVCASMFIYS